MWGKGSMSPGLALDLEGGTQLILTPSAEGAEITDTQIKEAIRIMRQRVDASGVSEAEISSQGGTNIVVQLPGSPSQETIDLVQSAAQLRFRAVLTEAGPAQIDPAALQEQQDQSDGGASGDQDGSGDQASSGQGSGEGSAGDAADGSARGTAGGAVARATGDDPSEGASDEATDEATDPAAGSGEQPSDTPSEQPQNYSQEEIEAAAKQAADTDGDGELSDTPATEPTSPSDTAWITEQVMYDFYMLDCTDPANLAGGGGDDPEQPLVACSQEGDAKYILEPVELEGTDVASANSALGTTESGTVTNQYVVQLDFTSEGGQKFKEVTQRLATLVSSGQNRFAIVLDRLVISAPSVENVIGGGQAEISAPPTAPFTQR